MLCINETYDIDKQKGKCPEECEHGAWNYTGMCGAECLNCGGTVYETKQGLYCAEEKKIVDEDEW